MCACLRRCVGRGVGGVCAKQLQGAEKGTSRTEWHIRNSTCFSCIHSRMIVFIESQTERVNVTFLWDLCVCLLFSDWGCVGAVRKYSKAYFMCRTKACHKTTLSRAVHQLLQNVLPLCFLRPDV